jgi:hypothetical protein
MYAKLRVIDPGLRKELGGYRPFGVATITAVPWDGDR